MLLWYLPKSSGGLSVELSTALTLLIDIVFNMPQQTLTFRTGKLLKQLNSSVACRSKTLAPGSYLPTGLHQAQ